MTTDAAGTPAPPVAAPAKNTFQRIAGVLFAPAETFQDIARKPNIIAPLVIILAIGYLTTVLAMPHLDFDAMVAQQTEMMKKQNPNMSESDMERVGRMTKAAAKVMGFIGPLLAALWYVIVAAALLLAVRLMGGEGNFAQAFSATLYAWFPLILFGIIATVVMIARGSVDPTQMATIVKSNPAFLVDMKEQPLLFALLSSIDIFTIWTIVLLIFGFSAVSRLSRAKTAAIVIALWVVMLVIKVGFAAIGAARMKA